MANTNFNNQNTNQNVPEIIDEEDYTYGDSGKITINKIIQNHIDRISRYIFGGGLQPEYKDGAKGQTITKNSERREVVIEAIRFLEALIKDKFDETITNKRKEIYDKINEEEERLFESQLDLECHNRAMVSLRKGASRDEFLELYNYWKKKLKDLKVQVYDKDSPEYEFHLTVKHNLFLEFFEEMMLLMSRKDWGAEDDYTE